VRMYRFCWFVRVVVQKIKVRILPGSPTIPLISLHIFSKYPIWVTNGSQKGLVIEFLAAWNGINHVARFIENSYAKLARSCSTKNIAVDPFFATPDCKYEAFNGLLSKTFCIELIDNDYFIFSCWFLHLWISFDMGHAETISYLQRKI
jgi:hypothetical protein